MAFLLLAGVGCGRTHDLEQGTYLFAVSPSDVFRDDCGLASGGGPTLRGQLQSFGDDIQLAVLQQSSTQCLPVEMVGQYQYNTQNFFADGTASHPMLTANGSVCQVSFVQFHLDGVTLSKSTFSGVMRINYLSSTPVSCNCQLWFNFQAALCTSPGCPSVPPQCS